MPIGLEEHFQGLIDLVQLKAYHFHGSSGCVTEAACLSLLCDYVCLSFMLISFVLFCRENVVASDIPADMEALVAEKRRELIETVSEVDDKLADVFLSDEPISPSELEVCWENFQS